MMTRLEQETYEVIVHSMPRIADALERIATALEHKMAADTDGDEYHKFLSGLKPKEAK